MYGNYIFHSALPCYNFCQSELLSISDHLKNSLSDFDLYDFQPQLIYSHEQQHFRQFTYTTFGLSLWRIHNYIACDTLYIINFIKNNICSDNFHLPLREWWTNNGRKLIENSIGLKLPLEFTQSAINKGIPIAHSSIRLAFYNYVEKLFQDIDTLQNLLELLKADTLKTCNISAAKGVEILNKAMKVLGEKTGLGYQFKIELREKSNKNFFPPRTFSLRQILEGDAKCCEIGMLKSVLSQKANRPINPLSKDKEQEILQDWLNHNITDNESAPLFDYSATYNYGSNKIKDDFLVGISSFLSLCGEIDISCNKNKTVYVEDIIPQWRYISIIERMSHIKKSNPNISYENLIRNSIARLNWPQPEDTYSHIIKNPLSINNTWTADANRAIEHHNHDTRNKIIPSRYIALIESKIHKNFEMLSTNFFKTLITSKDRPLVEIFSRSFSINEEYYDISEEDKIFMPANMFTSIIQNEIAFQFYSGKCNINSIDYIYNSFFGKINELVPGSWKDDTLEFIEKNFGKLYKDMLIKYS